MRIGGHFHSDNPLADAVACGARLAQFFLGDPQGWKGPVIPGGDPGDAGGEIIGAVIRNVDLQIIAHTPANSTSDVFECVVHARLDDGRLSPREYKLLNLRGTTIIVQPSSRPVKVDRSPIRKNPNPVLQHGLLRASYRTD